MFSAFLNDSLRIYDSSVSSIPNTWMDAWMRAILTNAAARLSSGVRHMRSGGVGWLLLGVGGAAG